MDTHSAAHTTTPGEIQNFYDFPHAYQERLECLEKDENYVPLISLFSLAGASPAWPLRFDRTKLNATIFTFGIVTGYSLPKPKTNWRASHDFSMTIFVIDPTLRLPQGHSSPALPLTIFFNSLDCQVLPHLPAGTGAVPDTPEGAKLPLSLSPAVATALKPFQLPKTSSSSFLPFAVGDVVHFQGVKVQEYKDLPQFVTMKGSNITIRHYQYDHISGVRKSSLRVSEYKLLFKAFGDGSSKTKNKILPGDSDARKKGQSFQIKFYPSMHCIASAFQTISDESVESNEDLEMQLSRHGDAVLLSESLSVGLLPHTDLHSIATWISTSRSLKTNMPTSPYDAEDSHVVRINGKSIAEIISDGGLLTVPKCDTVCLYTGCRQSKIGDITFTYLKLWDGSNHGSSTVSDYSPAHLAVKFATLFAGTKDTEQLKAREQQAIALLLEQAARTTAQSSSSTSPSSSSSSSIMFGEELEVLLNPQISPLLTDNLLPGTWLRIRNLHLTLEEPSIHFDTHVCTLKPYFRDVSILIEKYSARVLADRQKSAAQLQRNRQLHALTHNSVGHPFTVLAVCQATPAPAKFCIRVRITGWWPTDIRKFLVHYNPDTYSHIEPTSGLSLSRRSRTSGIFFVLKVQDERETGVHCDLMVSGADAEYFFSAVAERNGFVSSTAPSQQPAMSDAFMSIWMQNDVSSHILSGSSSSSIIHNAGSNSSSADTLLEAFERRLRESVQSAEMLEMYVESYDSFGALTTETTSVPVNEVQAGRGKKRNVYDTATASHLPEKSHVRRLRLFNTKIPAL